MRGARTGLIHGAVSTPGITKSRNVDVGAHATLNRQ